MDEELLNLRKNALVAKLILAIECAHTFIALSNFIGILNFKTHIITYQHIGADIM